MTTKIKRTYFLKTSSTKKRQRSDKEEDKEKEAKR